MAQSLEKRLGEKTEGFVRDVDLFGYGPAERKYGVKDHMSAYNLIQKKTGNPGYGRNPKINLNDGRNLGELVIDALMDRVAKVEERHAEEKVKWLKEKESLTVEIDYLRLQLESREMENLDKTTEILARCTA